MPHPTPSRPDTLAIRDIAFRAPCGVFAEERRLGMDYRADITLHLDIRKAAHSDDLADAVDYDAVARRVLNTARTERKLVERLAEDIATDLLAAFPVQGVAVALTKCHPPVESFKGGVTVTIFRER